MIEKLDQMDDAAVDLLRDAVLGETMLRSADEPKIIERLRAMSLGQLDELYELLSEESDRREENQLAVAAAHADEQAEAAEEAGVVPEPRHMLRVRAARLFKVVNVEAPAVIIRVALKLVIKSYNRIKRDA